MGKWELWTEEIKDAPPIPKVNPVCAAFHACRIIHIVLYKSDEPLVTDHVRLAWYECWLYFAGDGVQRDHSANCGYSAVYIPDGAARISPEGMSVCWTHWNWQISLHHGQLNDHLITTLNYVLLVTILAWCALTEPGACFHSGFAFLIWYFFLTELSFEETLWHLQAIAHQFLGPDHS